MLIVWQVVVGISLLAAWEGVGGIYGDTWTSRPSLVLAKLTTLVAGDLYVHIAVTVAEMLSGLALGTVLGVLAGLFLGRAPLLSEILRPIIVALYSVPLIALAPVLIMFFGLDMQPKIALVTMVVFFLLFFNTLAGVEAIDPDLIGSLELMGATRREEFQKVIAPASMVWILGGVKIALPYALVAATVGEILAARRGLGFLLTQASSQFDMTSLYATLFILMIMGMLTAELAVRLEHWLLRWRHASR